MGVGIGGFLLQCEIQCPRSAVSQNSELNTLPGPAAQDQVLQLFDIPYSCGSEASYDVSGPKSCGLGR